MWKWVIGVGIVVVLVILLVTSGGNDNGDDPYPFHNAQSCAELFGMFDDYPVSDNAAERKAVGDAYRQRFRELGCTL